MQPSYTKLQAIALREKGFSYNLISQKLGLSKSTLSDWLKDIPFHPNRTVMRRIQYGPLKSAEKRHNEKVKSIHEIKETAKREIGLITRRDIWMLGIGLYFGEGSKIYETVKVINSDPSIIKLAMRWLKEICGLQNENITVAVHLYPDNNEIESLHFWSRSLGLPLKQFRKTQIDTRLDKSGKKKRKLPYGTAHVSIVSNGNPKFGVKLHRRIMGWLEGIIDNV